MHIRVLVVARDQDIRTVFDPMLHLYGMVAVRADSIEAARDTSHVFDVHAVIVQASHCGVDAALDFFTTLRCSTTHADTPLLLLTGDDGLQDTEVAGARAVGGRVFKYPRQLDAILEYLETSTCHRTAA